MSAFVGVTLIHYCLCGLVAMCRQAGRQGTTRQSGRAGQGKAGRQCYGVRAAAVCAHNIGHNPS